MNLPLREQIERLYYDHSKHAAYQSLPEFVEDALDLKIELDHNWRSDRPRYDYLTRRLSFVGKRVVDIGANTGYFVLNLARTCGARAIAYEVNPNHAHLIEAIAEAFGIDGVSVRTEGLGLDDVASIPRCDVVLFSNVAHHAGHDFDLEYVPSRQALAGHLTAYLRALSSRAAMLFFQMGSNWGGNKQTPIVPVEDNPGKIRYAVEALQNAGWNIDRVAMAYRRAEGIVYVDVNWQRILAGGKSRDVAALDDALSALCNAGMSQQGTSEFFRRPLFICRREAP